jgi:hypothetical protein
LSLLLLSCDTKEKTAAEQGATQQPPVPSPAADAQNEEAKQKAQARQKELALAELRKEVDVHVAQLSSEKALVKIQEGLALDPQHPDFLHLESEVKQTLEHLCCGFWLRYDLSKPGATKKDLSAVLRSQDMGPNHRGHLFRGRVLLACISGVLSLRVRVPWDVPKSASAQAEYKLGEEKGSVTVKTDAAPFVYEFPEPEKWAQKLAGNENKIFEMVFPKRDGTQGTFTFELGQAKQISEEVLAACK